MTLRAVGEKLRLRMSIAFDALTLEITVDVGKTGSGKTSAKPGGGGGVGIIVFISLSLEIRGEDSVRNSLRLSAISRRKDIIMMLTKTLKKKRLRYFYLKFSPLSTS